MLVLVLIPSEILLGEISPHQFFPKNLHVKFFSYEKIILPVGQAKSEEKEKDIRQVIDQKSRSY